MELASERCRPCDGDPCLATADVQALLQQVPAWRQEGDRIVRDFRLRDFAAALEACRRIGDVAEQEGHHPDLHLTEYRSLRVELTTHAAGGLTRNDFVLAAKIDRVLSSVHESRPAPAPSTGTPRSKLVAPPRHPEPLPDDRILVRDLEVDCIIGTQPKERDQKQRVCINLEVACDTRAAASSDDIRQTLDYKGLKDRLLHEVGRSRHELLETLAQHVASLVLDDPKAAAVDVTVDKPGALTWARSVAVRIRRARTMSPAA